MIATPQSEAGELHLFAETDEIAALCLQGEFDVANAPQIIDEGERLLAEDKQVILDLSEATFIDSSAIHALFHVAAVARQKNHIAVLQLGTAPIVERMIEITKIDRVLPRVSTRAEAIATIHQLQRPA